MYTLTLSGAMLGAIMALMMGWGWWALALYIVGGWVGLAIGAAMNYARSEIAQG